MRSTKVSLLTATAMLLILACSAQAELPFRADFSQPLDLEVWKISDGNWTVENGELVARNADRGSGPNDPLTGFPFGTFDYVVALDVGTNMTVSVDATPVALNPAAGTEPNSFARIGLMVHSNGAAQFADRKWMLLYGWLDTQSSFGLALLEEAVAWRASDLDVLLEMGKTYTFKMEVIGTSVKGKVWEKGTAEPDWQVEDQFQQQLSANGVGLLGVGAEVRYSNLVAEPIAGARATVTGLVKDAVTGNPVAGASITNGEATATTATNGTYSLSVVAGVQEIVASKAGYIPTATTDPVDVLEGETFSGADIELRPERLPLTDDFNGEPKLAWEPPASAFLGDWVAEENAFIAYNADKGLDISTAYDYQFVPDVAADLILSAKVTPIEWGTGEFIRIGIATHVSGAGGGGDKKWMLMYGIMDTATATGLALLEEGLAWRHRTQDVQLELGKTYVFKMAVKGTEAKGKVWEDGTPEPAAWQLQDNFTLNQIREAGIALLGVGATVRYDDVRAEPYVDDAPPPPSVVPGDANGSGTFEITDVVAALQALAGLRELTAEQRTAANVTKSGTFGITDVVLMLRKLAGLAEFPA